MEPVSPATGDLFANLGAELLRLAPSDGSTVVLYEVQGTKKVFVLRHIVQDNDSKSGAVRGTPEEIARWVQEKDPESLFGALSARKARTAMATLVAVVEKAMKRVQRSRSAQPTHPRSGRPKHEDDGVPGRSPRMMVSVPSSLAEEIRRQSARDGISVSEWFIRAARAWMPKDGPK